MVARLPGQAHGGTADGVGVGRTSKKLQQNKQRGRAEKARERGTAIGGAMVDTHRGRWPEKEQRPDLGTRRPSRKLGLYLGVMASH